MLLIGGRGSGEKGASVGFAIRKNSPYTGKDNGFMGNMNLLSFLLFMGKTTEVLHVSTLVS